MSKARFNLKIVFGVIFLILLIFIARSVDIRALLDGVKNLGMRGALLFVLVYVIACVSFIPGSVLTLGAGAIFGVWAGSAVVSAGSTVGAACAFLIGRYFARDWVSKKISGNEKFKAIDDAVAADGFKMTFLIRLSPIFPFNLINYALGLTKVRLKDYVLASWIGMMPGTVMYVYLGSVAGDLAAAGAGTRSKTPAEWLLYGVGLAATVLVTVYVTRIAKKALESKVETGRGSAKQ
jgi:uncharacterized membrane protein YdjX (TVP38/TMEM64 family)